MNVLPFHKPEPERCSTGEAHCMLCRHTWAAVMPEGATWLECPACHTFKGRLRLPFYPAEGQSIRVCDCGNDLFVLTPEGHLCPNCGTYQAYD